MSSRDLQKREPALVRAIVTVAPVVQPARVAVVEDEASHPRVRTVVAAAVLERAVGVARRPVAVLAPTRADGLSSAERRSLRRAPSGYGCPTSRSGGPRAAEGV